MFTKLYFYRKIEYIPIDGVMFKEYNYQLVGIYKKSELKNNSIYLDMR